jgi:hypothetical protein
MRIAHKQHQHHDARGASAVVAQLHVHASSAYAHNHSLYMITTITQQSVSADEVAAGEALALLDAYDAEHNSDHFASETQQSYAHSQVSSPTPHAPVTSAVQPAERDVRFVSDSSVDATASANGLPSSTDALQHGVQCAASSLLAIMQSTSNTGATTKVHA